MTSSSDAAVSAPLPRFRRFASVGLAVVGVVMLVAVAGCALVPSPSLPPSRFVGWRLADGFLGTPRFDPTTAQTATVVPISVDWLTCAPKDDSWLAPPAITYTPSSVTITMHTTDAFAATTTCGGGNVGSQHRDHARRGHPVEVHLERAARRPCALRWRRPHPGRAPVSLSAMRQAPRPLHGPEKPSRHHPRTASLKLVTTRSGTGWDASEGYRHGVGRHDSRPRPGIPSSEPS